MEFHNQGNHMRVAMCVHVIQSTETFTAIHIKLVSILLAGFLIRALSVNKRMDEETRKRR